MYVFIECTLHLKHISTITREEATADRPGVGGWVCILCCRRNHSMALDIDDEKCARPGEMHVRSRTNDGTDWIVRLRPKGIYFYIFNIGTSLERNRWHRLAWAVDGCSLLRNQSVCCPMLRCSGLRVRCGRLVSLFSDNVWWASVLLTIAPLRRVGWAATRQGDFMVWAWVNTELMIMLIASFI